MQCPTGGGKTVIAAKMCGTVNEKKRRAFFIAHRDFLLEQTSLTFDRAAIPHSFIAAGGFPHNPHMRIQVCGVATLARRLDRVAAPDIIFWDECKHIAASTYQKVFEWAGPNCKHVGLDATPVRLDGKGLDLAFQSIVLGPTVAWLIENGFLSEYRAYAPSAPDLSGVHTTAGDFNRGELVDVMDKGAIVGNMVGHYKALAGGRRAVYFAVSVEHSQHIAAAFNAAGIPARHLDASSSTQERSQAARDFARGKLSVLVNVDLFGEGYDLAAQAGQDVAIDCVGLARPTQSLALHLQQCGRALRPAPGKEYAVILDHAGNLARHGLPDDEREWTLAGRSKKQKDTGPIVRQCPECYGVHPATKPACPYCGYVHPKGEGGRAVEEQDGDLKEIDVKAMRAARAREEWQCQTIEDLIRLGVRRGYSEPEKWAGYKWTARQAAAQRRVEAQAAQYRMRF
jgi:superfamily II DNA or RNA helicase